MIVGFQAGKSKCFFKRCSTASRLHAGGGTKDCMFVGSHLSIVKWRIQSRLLYPLDPSCSGTVQLCFTKLCLEMPVQLERIRPKAGSVSASRRPAGTEVLLSMQYSCFRACAFAKSY